MMNVSLRNVLTYVAVVIALAGSAPRAGTSAWVDVSTTSYHAGGNAGYNSNNFGLGAEVDRGNEFAMAGRYKNSLGAPSRYALLGYTPIHILGADIGAVIGALDGYQPMRNGHTFLAAGGVARWTGARYGAQLLLMPPIKGSVKYDADGGYWTRHATPAAIGLQLRVRFK